MNTNNKNTLLIMAAGMGSRFGGLKQIEPVGPDGEVILDYSVYDAVKAGFGKVVFVIKKEIESDFRDVVGKRIEKITDVEYVFQEMLDLPLEINIPAERKKPWGTCHAVLSARNVIDTPFAVLNADDYYGRDAFMKIHNHLNTSDDYAMIAFNLYNTLTDNGTVSRGVCKIENGYLSSIEECKKIDKNSGFSLDTKVSMNLWGFTPDVFDRINNYFVQYLKRQSDYAVCEYLLPDFIDEIIKNENKKIKVLSSDDKWYGVTYREDLPQVRNAIKELHDKGIYI